MVSASACSCVWPWSHDYRYRGIDQGSGAVLIGSVVGMAFLSLLLIFGIEVDSIEIGDKFRIDFSSATTQEKVVEVSDDEDKDE